MAYIQKVKRKQDINYRVFIKVGSKRITKTFNSKRAAVQFANGIESDRNKLPHIPLKINFNRPNGL